MTYFKIIFLLILAMLEKCQIITKTVEPLKPIPSEVVESRDSTDITGSWQWQQTAVGSTSRKMDRSRDSVQNSREQIQPQSSLYSFFQDSTFTKIERGGSYRYGTYTLTPTTLSLHYEASTENYGIAFDTISGIHRVFYMTDQKGNGRQYVENAFPLKNFTSDPFYHANNTWRIKPIRPESTQQIQRRLTNYLKHACTIFKAATDRNQSTISWTYSQGIIVIYSRGVGSVGPDTLPESWVNAFYSRNDAQQAYEMFEQYLRSGETKVKSTGDWVKDDYNILLNIYEQAERRALQQTEQHSYLTRPD
jgi:hypothetical protein